LSRTKKQQYQLSQLASNLELEDSDTDGYNEVDVYVAYRRPTVVDENGDEPLSDYILDRLQDARMLAMAAYEKAHM
jgi:hypothetical protein